MFTSAWECQLEKFVDYSSFSPCDSYILQFSFININPNMKKYPQIILGSRLEGK